MFDYRKATNINQEALHQLALQYRVYAPHWQESYIALYQEKMIAFMAWRICEDEAELLGVAVDALWQNQGIGQALHHHSAPHALCFLEVRESNTQALSFYHRLTYRIIGRRKRYYQHPEEDALIMRCDRRHLRFNT